MNRRSFLMGLSVGRSLKGWGGSTGASAFSPRCWNESGVYDRFYIDYGVGVQAFSYGRFCNKTGIFGAAGEISPTAAERVDGTTVCIHADISGETRVRVYGNAKAGLTLADGQMCPAYAAEFWVDGAAPHELPYAAESMALGAAMVGVEEVLALVHPGREAQSMAEAAALTAVAVGTESESVSVVYA